MSSKKTDSKSDHSKNIKWNFCIMICKEKTRKNFNQ